MDIWQTIRTRLLNLLKKVGINKCWKFNTRSSSEPVQDDQNQSFFQFEKLKCPHCDVFRCLLKCHKKSHSHENPFPCSSGLINPQPIHPGESTVPETVLEQTESDYVWLSEIESWKGRKEYPLKDEKCFHEVKSLDADTHLKQKQTKIDLLKNGNFLAKTTFEVDQMQVSVINTCAFDSFCQSLCSAVCDSASFADHLQKQHCKNDMLDLVKTIITIGVGDDAYAKRAKILFEMFESEPVSGEIHVDAACNVYSIVTATMKDVPSATLFIKCSSPYCSRHTGSSRSVAIVPVNVEIVRNRGLKLKEAIENGLNLNQSKCLMPLWSAENCPDDLKWTDDTNQTRCCGFVTHTFKTGPLLCVEMEDMAHALCEIPVSIDLDNHLFTLRSVVVFIPAPRWQTIGHYVAYCRRTSGKWEKYDDLRDHVRTVSAQKIIRPHLILYTKDDQN